MGVVSFEEEVSSKVAPARLFKGLMTDSHNLIPKIAPQVIKSAELVQGDGGAGSIKQLNYADGAFVKLKIDELNEGQFIGKYTVIEGRELSEKIKCVVTEIKCEPTADGGSIVKVKRVVTLAEGAELTPEEIQTKKTNAKKLFEGIEGYLLTNPDVYA